MGALIKKVVIDADFLVFQVTEGINTKMSYFPTEDGWVGDSSYKESLKPYKKKIKELIKELMDTVAVQTVSEPWKLETKPLIVFSDPDTNFRYKLDPNYKSNRKSDRSELFYRLRSWCVKKYTYEKGFEADDIVAYYVKQENYLGISFDKDLLRNVEGLWFDCYYSRMYIVKTDYYESSRHILLQTLAGDPTDGIKGIFRVGFPTAEKLLNEFGWDFSGVIKAYESKGLTKEDAILTRRLVGMDQVKKKKDGTFKLKLFKI